MQITKFGHSCVLIEIGQARILFDPGNFNTLPELRDIDVLLITHEHQDHIDIPLIKQVLTTNPELKIYTHGSVQSILNKEGITSTIINDGQVIDIKGTSVESIGVDHACIHHDLPLVRNTGFLVADRVYHPGDSFTVPQKPVDILLLPVAAPWLTIENAVEYAKKVNPRTVVPIHDGMMRQDRLGATRRIPTLLLEPLGINFIDLSEGETKSFD